MKVYGITTCGSVKKAQSFLKAKGLAYDFVDLKKEAVGEEKLTLWLSKQPMSILFNTKGTKFRTLGLDKTISDAVKKTWLLKEQLLYKRPIIECDDGALLVGFDEEIYQKTFS
ncbi:MAG: Spx/MgsR family RNA polymerase-binding regulatory protein [Sulfurospirillaceae bacterium]|jgi:Spx/MgsR family transcriptional regulator|nr:Spx/MgsR family RNA polymerase-binding regulatory protein [Sulfurospirillaceae bacterium]MDD2827732.1 Spx/MgsR family RNA polymerase-binding regulatory protein [Sulfurospirillaceae bacterium]